MGKDTRLVNIYLKIHHKQPLTMDDLAYLAEYAPECFEKTCKNVVYNIPETKPIMEPVAAKSQDSPQISHDTLVQNNNQTCLWHFPCIKNIRSANDYRFF